MSNLKLKGPIALAAAAWMLSIAVPAGAAEELSQPIAVEQRVGDFSWFEAYAPYLLTSTEMKNYKLARTPLEKQEVIDQFWQLRDPDPRSPRNPYREAFYARMDYANKRFAQGVAGYKTTRGMVYVLLGPPSEYHYFNSFRGGWPVETWTYWSTDSRRLPAQYTIGFDLTAGRGGIRFTWFPGQTGFERILSRNRSGLGGYLPPEMVAAIQDLSRKAIVQQNT